MTLSGSTISQQILYLIRPTRYLILQWFYFLDFKFS